MQQELQDAFLDAFRESREAFGVPIAINGQTIEALVSDAEFSRELSEGGFSSSADIKAHILASDLTTPVAVGQRAVFKGAAFRVVEVAQRPGNLIAEVRLEPVARR